jgi:hypothetical protein
MFANRRIWPVVAIAAIGVLSLQACGQATAQPLRASGTAASGRFPRPTMVSNRMFPLVPGTRFSYSGTVVEGGSATPHTVVFTVTDLTKVVAGVRTVVALDQDFLQGQLQEQELAFFAQDASGNVWNFGEYPEEYSSGRLTGAPDTWITGTAGARGGRHMLARPAAGLQYTEGRVPAIEFYDVSRVVSTRQVTCLPSGCLRHVLKVDEWSPNDPASGHQIKYYAPGVGLVRVGARGGDSREYLRLVAVSHLGRTAMSHARAAALKMDQRAYRISKVYRATRPATQQH